MKAAAKNLSQISYRLLLRDHISTDNDHCRNIILERIILTTAVATVSLCLIVFLIYKFFHRPNHSPPEENPTETKPSIDVELASIPVVEYGEPTPLPSDISLNLENCAICLEDYVHGDRVRVLPRCKHMFHKNCIEEWLQFPSLHCPICRDRILEHRLQSAGCNNCRNQGSSNGNPFPFLAFSFGPIRYASYPSELRNYT